MRLPSVRPAARTDPSVSPAATRARRPGWRDPRLAVGLVLVCASVLLGARVLDGADDTVGVLAARGPLAAGQEVGAADLVTVRLRFAEERDAERYLPEGGPPADGSLLLRPLGAGELVPRSAVGAGGAAEGAALVELPLGLDPVRVPVSVRAGSTVDVWVAGGRAERLLAAVPVLSTTRGSAAGPSGLRQVVVGVAPADQDRLDEVVARVADGSLLLVRRAG